MSEKVIRRGRTPPCQSPVCTREISNERETTVSIKDLAQAGKQVLSEEEKTNNEEIRNGGVVNESNQDIDFSISSVKEITRQQSIVPNIRNHRPPIRFVYEEY